MLINYLPTSLVLGFAHWSREYLDRSVSINDANFFITVTKQCDLLTQQTQISLYRPFRVMPSKSCIRRALSHSTSLSNDFSILCNNRFRESSLKMVTSLHNTDSVNKNPLLALLDSAKTLDSPDGF